FFSSRRRHTRCYRDWSSDVCSSDLVSGRRLDRIAGIEHHGAALFHVGVDTIDGVLRRLRGARHNGPVDQRKEGQFVVGGIDADEIGRASWREGVWLVWRVVASESTR